jgi:hypothetical protein
MTTKSNDSFIFGREQNQKTFPSILLDQANPSILAESGDIYVSREYGRTPLLLV